MTDAFKCYPIYRFLTVVSNFAIQTGSLKHGMKSRSSAITPFIATTMSRYMIIDVWHLWN